MGEKEKKKFIIVDNIDPTKKDIIYLTLLVVTFALFFVTFLALNSAEDRCFNQFSFRSKNHEML